MRKLIFAVPLLATVGTFGCLSKSETVIERDRDKPIVVDRNAPPAGPNKVKVDDEGVRVRAGRVNVEVPKK